MLQSRARDHLFDPAGFALLMVLGIILVVSSLSASFIWFMNQAQTRAGERHRTIAAMAVAEGGVHRALQIFESVAPDGSPGRTWRPIDYTEALQVGSLEGRFTLSAVDDPDGAIIVTSVGETAGIVRRLRARIYLASPVLLSALHTSGAIYLEKPPAAVLILSAGTIANDGQWGHITAGKGIWVGGPGVSIKGGRVPRDLRYGPLDASLNPRPNDTVTGTQPIRLVVGRGAELLVGRSKRRVDLRELRAMGVDFEGNVEGKEVPKPPHVDEAFYRALAVANANNARINQAAGRYHGDSELAGKTDSLYSEAHFEQIQAYLRTGIQDLTLSGTIYVKGDLEVPDGERLPISDGALISEGTVFVGEDASLEITHAAATRTLPGLLTLRDGALEVAGRLRVHGLVYTNGKFDVDEGARVEIIGAVLSAESQVSLRNLGATVTVGYDPAVLGTPGVRVPNDCPVVAWVAAWQELEPAAPVTPPVSPILPSPTAPPAAAPVAPSPQPLEMVPSLRAPPAAVRRHKQSPQRIFTVQVGAYSIRENAEERTAALRRAGFPPRVVIDRGLYKVRVGTFHDRAQAEELADQLRARGYGVIIVR